MLDAFEQQPFGRMQATIDAFQNTTSEAAARGCNTSGVESQSTHDLVSIFVAFGIGALVVSALTERVGLANEAIH